MSDHVFYARIWRRACDAIFRMRRYEELDDVYEAPFLEGDARALEPLNSILR